MVRLVRCSYVGLAETEELVERGAVETQEGTFPRAAQVNIPASSSCLAV